MMSESTSLAGAGGRGWETRQPSHIPGGGTNNRVGCSVSSGVQGAGVKQGKLVSRKTPYRWQGVVWVQAAVSVLHRSWRRGPVLKAHVTQGRQ